MNDELIVSSAGVLNRDVELNSAIAKICDTHVDAVYVTPTDFTVNKSSIYINKRTHYVVFSVF